MRGIIMPKPKITVIGSSNTDLVAKVPRMPAPGETILGAEFVIAAGGKGANQAVAAARLGSEVTFIAKVGNDDFGDRALENFEQDGIITDFVFRAEHTPTGVALIFVDEKGENTIAVAEGANAKLSPEEVTQAKASIISADIVLLQLEIPMQTVEQAVLIASKANVPIILNPAPAQPIINPLLLENITFLTPNENEAALLTGIQIDDEASAQQAGRELLKSDVSNVILTLGNLGAMFVNSKQSIGIPARKVEAVDTTGAGDVFNGALAFAIASGKGVEDAIELANAAAALACTKMGAQPSIPTIDEVAQFIVCSELETHSLQ